MSARLLYLYVRSAPIGPPKRPLHGSTYNHRAEFIALSRTKIRTSIHEEVYIIMKVL